MYLLLLALIVLPGMLIFPEKCIAEGYDSLIFCGKVIIPSLLPFFICVKILTVTGISKKIGDKLSFIMGPLFNVPGQAGFAFFMGGLSGFPMGAKCTAELLDNNLCTKNEAQRIICFCNNASPLFVIGTVGSVMLVNKNAGVMLYVSHILSAITVGFILGFKRKSEPVAFVKTQNQTSSFSNCIADGVNLILYVCGTIMFFNVLICALDSFGVFNIFPQNIKTLIIATLEMTKGISKIATTFNAFKLPAISFALGFSGLCVILQIAGVVEKYNLSIVKLIFAKLMQGAISFIYTCLLMQIPVATPVFNPVPYPLSFWGSMTVGIMFLVVSFAALAIIEIIAEIIRFSIYKTH